MARGHVRWYLKALLDALKGLQRELKNRKPISKETINRLRMIRKLKPGFIYKVSGYLKTDNTVRKEMRSFFVRMDFFDSLSSAGERRIYSSVSSRYYGSGWQKVELLTFAPQNAKYAKVSVQAYRDGPTNYSVKNVVLEESVDFYILKDNYEKIDFGKYKDLLYPYSHGNL